MSWTIRVLACLTLLPLPLATLAFVPLRPSPWNDDAVTAKQIVSSIGMTLVRIEPGIFQMGSPATEPGRNNNEQVHEVEISKPFYLGKYEVTQEEYEKVMGTNPSAFKKGNAAVVAQDTRRYPVDNASWDDAKIFCKKLTDMDRRAGKITVKMEYTLPMEAEWEYACRAGTKTAFSFGASITTDQVNYAGGVRNGTAPVGSYPPNAWGLCDMHGNLCEWCEDWYDTNYYGQSPRKDPPGAQQGSIRVLRGGSWQYHQNNCRSALRDGIGANFRGNFCGFRVVLRLASKSS